MKQCLRVYVERYKHLRLIHILGFHQQTSQYRKDANTNKIESFDPFQFPIPFKFQLLGVDEHTNWNLASYDNL